MSQIMWKSDRKGSLISSISYGLTHIQISHYPGIVAWSTSLDVYHAHLILITSLNASRLKFENELAETYHVQVTKIKRTSRCHETGRSDDL